ncbi:MAG: hypothetical protein ABSD74_02240 [Rhizomicrobium sp.]|jgi:hypothetical protein
MSTYSNTGESFISNLLTGTMIAVSAFLVYAVVALPQPGQAVQAPSVAAPPAIEQVVVTASRHIS